MKPGSWGWQRRGCYSRERNTVPREAEEHLLLGVLPMVIPSSFHGNQCLYHLFGNRLPDYVPNGSKIILQ